MFADRAISGRCRLAIVCLLVIAAVSLRVCIAGSLVTPFEPGGVGEKLPFEPLAIVVNQSNPVENLSTADLKTIFLSERSYWATGRRITLVMREIGEPERTTVVRDVCGMTESQLKTHVLRGLFTGEILVSPKILSSPMGVRKFIFNVPGAIGYLRVGDLDGSVKVVRIDNLLPTDKGYKLHVEPAPEKSNE
jgi:ABC-type phosphate transport system substrate-binding protein